MAFEFQVTFDSADPRTHAAFWMEALHYVENGVEDDYAVLVDPDGKGPRIYFHKVPEPKTAKNRVHLDIRAAPGRSSQDRERALDEESVRLIALGAQQVERLGPDGENDLCIVMRGIPKATSSVSTETNDRLNRS